MMQDTSGASVLASLLSQAAVFEALLLAASALHKALGWSRSIAVTRRFAGMPGAMAAPALGAVILAEVAAAAMLTVPGDRIVGASAACAIWVVYLLLIVRAILKGRRDEDCGCSFAGPSRPLGGFQIARNTALAAVALGLAVIPVVDGEPPPVSQWLGGLAVLSLYGAVDQVMGLRPLRRGELL
jgi:hypothetical protein